MLEILEGKGLSFLFPLMKLEKELLKQIKVDPSPQSIYKWIKENISPKLHTDKGFVNILMTRYAGSGGFGRRPPRYDWSVRPCLTRCVFDSFLQYISYEINPDDDEEQLAAPSKEKLEEEKQLLLSFKPVMQKFLHDHINLQVSALYALQVHCNAKAFPKGMRTLEGCGLALGPPLPHGNALMAVCSLQECCCATLSTFTTWR